MVMLTGVSKREASEGVPPEDESQGGKESVSPPQNNERTPRPEMLRPRSQSQWKLILRSAALRAVSYLSDVLREAFVMLQRPLSFVLVVLFFAMLVPYLRATVHAAVYPTLAMLTQLCQLPGFSHLSVCGITNLAELAQPGVQHADYPCLVDIQTATFEQLLDDSLGSAGLALDIKKAEMATTDLSNLVRISQLTNKDTIADTLNTFVEDAKQAGKGLKAFSARVNYAVDGIIIANEHSLKRIEIAASEPSQSSTQKNNTSVEPAHPQALLLSFKEAMSHLEAELHRLIFAAEASIYNLEKLERQLNTLHLLVAIEGDLINVSKQELLSNLWTVVGGNSAALRRHDKHLVLLAGLTEYRKKALAHVVGALQKLQAMSADLDALRERVSLPVLSESENISLEVHVKSIRAGLERLTQGRLNARKVEDARYAKFTEFLGA